MSINRYVLYWFRVNFQLVLTDFISFEKGLRTFLIIFQMFVKFRQDRCPGVFSTAPDPQNNQKIHQKHDFSPFSKITNFVF